MQLYVSNVCRNWETLKLIKLNRNNSNQIKCGEKNTGKSGENFFEQRSEASNFFFFMEMFVI